MEKKVNMIEYFGDGRIKVYLAGPFFNEEQIERIEFIETLLETYDFDIFSPRQASLIKPGCSQEEMMKTFEGNVTHIDNADFVLAVLDGNDAGTMFECGYAYAKNIPVMYFNETRPEDKGPNLMLALSTKLPFIMQNRELEPRDYLEKALISINETGVREAEELFEGNNFDEVE